MVHPSQEFFLGGSAVIKLILDIQFFNDLRIIFLGQLAAEPAVTARGRVASLWYDAVSKDDWVKTPEQINMASGWFNPEKGHFADLLVQAGLADKLGDLYILKPDVCDYQPKKKLGTKRDHGPKLNFDFEALYKEYPRKVQKGRGIGILKADLVTQEDYDQCLVALQKYKKYVTGFEPKFIQHFGTWANHWRDWLDPDAGTTQSARRQVTLLSLEDL